MRNLLFDLLLLLFIQTTINAIDVALTIDQTVIRSIQMDKFIGFNFDSSQLRNGIFHHVNTT
jgi:hypothetical protein